MPIHLSQTLFASVLLASSALAHGPVIPLTLSGPDTIVTHALDLDGNDANGYAPGDAARSFRTVPLAYQGSTAYATDNGWYGQLEPAQPSNGDDTTLLGPGLAFGAGGFSATTVFRVTFTQAAQVWSPDGSAAGGGFTATGGELIQGLRGNFSPAGFANGLTSDGVQGGTGLLTGAVGTGNVDNHSQLRWRLLGATRSPVPSAGNVIDDGLYLAVLKVSAYADASATTPYAASLPYALLFEKNAGGTVTTADEANARAVVAANVVPEPTGLIGLVGGVYAVTRRRRTATV